MVGGDEHVVGGACGRRHNKGQFGSEGLSQLVPVGERSFLCL